MVVFALPKKETQLRASTLIGKNAFFLSFALRKLPFRAGKFIQYIRVENYNVPNYCKEGF